LIVCPGEIGNSPFAVLAGIFEPGAGSFPNAMGQDVAANRRVRAAAVRHIKGWVVVLIDFLSKSISQLITNIPNGIARGQEVLLETVF
jgi:hypothetical protein